jgi:3-oxoacyl-[acyl-carrier protein] reductase
VIAPGGITTEDPAASLKGVSAEQMETMLPEFAKMIPLGRMGEPDDIAGVAIFLASPSALIGPEGSQSLRTRGPLSISFLRQRCNG